MITSGGRNSRKGFEKIECSGCCDGRRSRSGVGMRGCDSWRGITAIILDSSLSIIILLEKGQFVILHAETCSSFPNSFLGDSNMSLEMI